MEHLRSLLEKSVFGVFANMGDHFGIRTSRIRLYFIYLSFLTFGSPLILYLVAAFWINLRKYLQQGKHAILD